jgi:hypothetical protein
MLSELRNELLTGEVVSDRATVERLIRSVGALLRLHDRHRIDRHGRCTVCLADTPRMVATLAETVRLHDTRGADILFSNSSQSRHQCDDPPIPGAVAIYARAAGYATAPGSSGAI